MAIWPHLTYSNPKPRKFDVALAFDEVALACLDFKDYGHEGCDVCERARRGEKPDEDQEGT